MAPRQQKPPPSNVDDILAQAAEELGIDPSVLMGAGADPYAIFTGVDPTDRVVDRNNPTRTRRSNIPEGAHGTGRARDYIGPGTPRYTQVGEVLKRFYQMDPRTLRRYQALLYAGGFFGNLDITEVRWGMHDDDSFAAWSQAVARTARLNAAGKPVTWSQVIGDAAWAAGLNPEELGAALQGSDEDLEALLSSAAEDEGDIITVALSDPNALRATIDQVSSAVLGRKSNAAEQRMFVALMHGLQREGQVTAQTAQRDAERAASRRLSPAAALGFGDDVLPPGDTVVEYSSPDADATAEAMIRQENPGEAGAHDIAIQFANLLDLLDSPVDVPRLTLGG